LRKFLEDWKMQKEEVGQHKGEIHSKEQQMEQTKNGE
jgi:hypothetical protein